MRYGFIDAVNNAILMVRVAPSNAYLIVGRKSPVLVFGYHYNMFFLGVTFFHPFYPNALFRFLAVPFSPLPNSVCFGLGSLRIMLWLWKLNRWGSHALRNRDGSASVRAASEPRIVLAAS
jgi:hypothetical protein